MPAYGRYVGVLTLGVVSGCGAGGAAEAVRPDAPTAASALGEDSKAECRDVSQGAEPLIVDWKPEQRGDLEIAMKDGIVVVAYDCDGVRLLNDCKLSGAYGYTGMTRREQVVRLSGADEVKANLPFSGGAIGGEVARGSGLDIGIVLIGKHRTTWRAPTRSDLEGSCDGATHYVSAATVGAFVLSTATSAKVAAAAELFGAGASTKSQSERQTKNQDGDPKACAAAKPDDATPPSQCGAAVRLALAPITAATKDAGETVPAPLPANTEQSCPAGLVLAEGKCTEAKTASSYLCAPNDDAECAAQCDKGNAGSCASLGRSLARSGKAPEAASRFEKACDGGDAGGCAALAAALVSGDGIAKDEAKAKTVAERACQDGAAAGCTTAGKLLLTSDKEGAQRLLAQGCQGGDPWGCAEAGKASGDKVEALRLHERACHGGVQDSCLPVASAYESGSEGLPKNQILAQMLYRRACLRNNPEACFHLGRSELLTQKESAKGSLRRACVGREVLACALLNLAFGERNGAIVDVPRRTALQGSCAKGNVRDCTLLGIAEAATGMPTAAQRFSMACTRGDKLACELAKKP